MSYQHVFISDQEDSLKSAVRELLPTNPQLLCMWHINKNALKNAQVAWRDVDGVTKEEKEAIKERKK
jgi:hypothetical protein